MPDGSGAPRAHADASGVEATLARLDARGRVRWALEHLPGAFALTSSFGAQSAVMLHLVTRERPDIPVILVDTGYLFPETYRFIDTLTTRLSLDLRVYRARRSPAWQEAVAGRRWEHGAEGIDAYNLENKVEPLQRALDEIGVGTWFAGLRRSQADERAETSLLVARGGRCKVHPIADWTDRDIYRYLRDHDLPYHPLWHRGYASIGDVHTTRALHEVDDPSELRFFGLRRECGIHLMDFGGAGDSAAPGPQRVEAAQSVVMSGSK